MKKLFISQPMRDKTNKQIKEEREKVVEIARQQLGGDVEVIDSFFENAPHDANPLWFLAKSLELMSTADAVFFVKGWEGYRGCRIEHTAALEYDIPRLF